MVFIMCVRVMIIDENFPMTECEHIDRQAAEVQLAAEWNAACTSTAEYVEPEWHKKLSYHEPKPIEYDRFVRTVRRPVETSSDAQVYCYPCRGTGQLYCSQDAAGSVWYRSNEQCPDCMGSGVIPKELSNGL